MAPASELRFYRDATSVVIKIFERIVQRCAINQWRNRERVTRVGAYSDGKPGPGCCYGTEVDLLKEISAGSIEHSRSSLAPRDHFAVLSQLPSLRRCLSRLVARKLDALGQISNLIHPGIARFGFRGQGRGEQKQADPAR